MKIISFILLSLIIVSTSTFGKSFDVKCYSKDHLIYHDNVEDVNEVDGVLVFVKNHHVIFTNGDCIIKYVKPVPKKKK